MRKNLAIIPARGGSKRIPHKNVKPFLGKPIITYSIETAIASGLFDEVMVSTDDEEIARIAKESGASVPFFRSPETSNDFATLADVIKEVVFRYKELGVEFDCVCCILATSPLIRVDTIVEAYNKLIHSDFISVYPIVPFSYPIMRSLVLNADGSVAMKWPEYATTRSQDIPPAYHDSGTFYWHKTALWMEGLRKPCGIVLDEMSVQDIDTETDWKMAELKYNVLFKIAD